MSMSKMDKSKQDVDASSIYDDLSLYKILRTNKNRTVIIHNDGGSSVIIPFEGLNNTSMNEESFESMFERMKTSIDSINPELFTITFTMVRDSNVGQEDTSKFPSFLRPRAEFLNNLSDNYMLFINKFYITIHCRTVTEIKENIVMKIYNNYIKHKNDHQYLYNKAMDGMEKRISSLFEVMDLVLDMMNDIGCKARIIEKEEEYYSILQEFTRPNKNKIEKIKVDSNDPAHSPRQQLFSGVRAKVSKKDFMLDDYYHKVYTLDRSPRKMIFGKSVEVLESFPAEFIYSISFRTATMKESLDKFKMESFKTRAAEGNNETALVEDRTLTAESQRISRSYDRFAYGDSVGIIVSANFVLRVKESFIEKLKRIKQLTREEIIRGYDNDLMKNVFAKFGLSEWVNEENTQWKVFCQCIPGMGNIYNIAFKTLFITSDNIPYFLPLYDNKRSHVIHNGTNHFVDKKGNRVDFDLMDKTMPAWNYSISGQTGSGKSVLVNAILTMQFAEMAFNKGRGPVICILDVGGDRGSYMKFMNIVKGTQINLSRTVKPAIQMFELIPDRSAPKANKIKEIARYLLGESDKHNMGYDIGIMEKMVYEFYMAKMDASVEELEDPIFIRRKFQEVFGFPEDESYRAKLALKPGECLPDTKKINVIMAVLDIILSSNPKEVDGFSHFEFDEVLEIVQETYKQTEGRYPLMSDLYRVAETMVDVSEAPSARKLLTKIKQYTKEGPYNMFDRETTINLENDVVLADLKGLESEPNLQAIYTLLISQLFNDKMYFIRNRRKIIIRDEAWSLMQNERARKFMMNDLRTARKNGFATIAISQLPTDYMNPDATDGRAIINSMQVNIFCKFDTMSVCREIGDEYRLSEEMVQEMSTLGVQKNRQGVPTHSKFMMLIGKEVYVLNNYLHPFEYQLYSSSADDNAIIDYYLHEIKLYNNLEDVLWYISEGKHIGDKGLIEYLTKAGATNMIARVRGH